LINWKQGEPPQEKARKCHATALSFYKTALNYMKKWTEQSFQDLESYSCVTLNITPIFRKNWKKFTALMSSGLHWSTL
jgi:hypothetical protein